MINHYKAQNSAYMWINMNSESSQVPKSLRNM